MICEEDIDGAFFYEDSPETWRCLATSLSENRKLLVRIYSPDDASLRVKYFKRGTDYNWAGEVWGQAKPVSSITDTFQQAQLLASAYLKNGAA